MKIALKKTDQKKKLGFSLAEVIVAALILALTVSGVLFIFSTERGTVSHTARKVEAMYFSQQTVEQLKNAPNANDWDTGPLSTGGSPYNAPLPASELRDTFGATRSYTVADGPPADSYRMVTVTVTWTDPVH